MDRDGDRCATELSDARVDLPGYACPVAIVSMGQGCHREAEARLHRATVDNGGPAPVAMSAGAGIDSLRTPGAKRISVIAPT